MWQDGSARPMTAVRAAGYTSSLTRGAFTGSLNAQLFVWFCVLLTFSFHWLSKHLFVLVFLTVSFLYEDNNNVSCYALPQCRMTCIFRIDLWPSGPVQRSCTSTGSKEWGHVSCHYLNQISLHRCLLVGRWRFFFCPKVQTPPPHQTN